MGVGLDLDERIDTGEICMDWLDGNEEMNKMNERRIRRVISNLKYETIEIVYD